MSVEETSGRHLSAAQAEALVQLLESSLRVCRRYQFFVWTQSQLHVLVPHSVLVCGSYHRHRKSLVYEAFYSVPLSAPAIEALSGAGGEIVRGAAAAWVGARATALAFEIARLPGDAAAREAALLAAQAGCEVALVHGVARPQRPAEIESLFLLLGPAVAEASRPLLHLDLVLPTLQAAWQRVLATERELRTASPALPAARRTPVAQRAPITGREAQILSWVREGRNNQQIGTQLGISPLTVKNHVQKILRKLGAANRAQAVAIALSGNLLSAEQESQAQ